MANTVDITFEANASDAVKAFDKVGAASKDMADDAEAASKSFRRAGDSFDTVAEGAGTADTRAMGFRDTITGLQDSFKGLTDSSLSTQERLLTLGMGFGDLASGVENLIAPMLKAMKTQAKMAVAWVVNHAKMAAATIASVAKQVAAWILLGVQSLLAAAKVALAWLISIGPIVLVIAAVVGLVILIIKNWDTIKDVIQKGWEFIKRITGPVWDAIVGFVRAAWEKIKQWTSTTVAAVKTAISTAWNTIKTVTSTVFNAIKTVITTVWNTIKTLISVALAFISSQVTTRWNAIKTTITVALTIIRATVSMVWNAIRTAITTALNIISSTVTRIFNRIKTFITSTINAVRDTVRRAIDAIVGFFRGIPGRIASALSGLASKVAKPFKDAYNAAKKWLDKIPGVGSVGKVGGWISGAIKRFHSGGVFEASGGRREGMALLESGEGVFTKSQMDAIGRGAFSRSAPAESRTVIEIRSGGSRIDDVIVELMRKSIANRGGGTVAVLG